jgi:DNA-binding transcriptional LysR family regulator
MDTLGSKAMRCILLVARYGSFRGAAGCMGAAPSIVSRQVAEVELRLGIALFERSARGVRLTAAGALVLDHVRRIADDEQCLLAQLASLRGMQQGRVRVLCGEGFVPDLIENGLRGFGSSEPRAVCHVETHGTAAIVDGVSNGDADIGIVYCPPGDGKVRTIAFAPQPLCAVVGTGHALTAQSPVPLAACLEYPHALLTEGHGIRQLVTRAAADQGIALAPILETTSFEALRQFVLTGMGVTFLPRFATAAEIARRAVVMIELRDQPLRAATAHLIVRARRRLPAQVDRLAKHLARSMLAFAEGRPVD